MNSLSRVACIFGVSAALFACAPAKPQPSGFLGDPRFYALLTPDPQLEGVYAYRENPYPLAGYDSYIVPPVVVYLNEEGRKRGITEQDLQELANKFRADIIKELGTRYAVADVPPAKTAILRLAITDADPNRPLLNLLPGTLLTGIGLGGATAEAEIINAESGERVAAFMASTKGKRYEFVDGLSKWGHTEAVLQDWATIIGDRVRKAHG